VSALTIPTLAWSPTPTTLTTAQTGTTIAGTPVTDSDGVVSYAIAGTGNSAGCSLASASAPVILSFATAGQCSITASTAATSTYAADSVTATFTVLALPTFAWTPTPTAFTTGQSPQTSLSATTNSDGAVTYAVSSTANSAGCSLASSSSPVRLSFTTAGSCTVTASVASTSSYAAATISRLFTITAGSLVSQAISFTGSVPRATVGAAYRPAATGGGSGNAVSFSIDPASTSGCTYNALTGVVTLSSPAGTCIIDANQAGSTGYAAASQTQQTINVAATPTTPVVSPSIAPKLAPLPGQVISFTSSPPATATAGARYTPLAAASSRLKVTITVALTSTSVCEISASGVVTFIAAGDCTLDADQAGDATNAAAPRLTQTIIVTKAANHHSTTLLLVLHYRNDTARLTPLAKSQITSLAKRMKADGLTHVTVTGYCSSPGSPAHNRILSEARARLAARALEVFLAARHADGIHLSGSGKGASDFVVLPSTRAGDRRVVITARR
jgi:outer membrane protein OmpA-like peptidoglycan-associated protein